MTTTVLTYKSTVNFLTFRYHRYFSHSHTLTLEIQGSLLLLRSSYDYRQRIFLPRDCPILVTSV